MKSTVLVPLALVLASCSGPYGDLETAFAVEQAASEPALEVERVVFTSQRHAGAHTFKSALRVRLLPTEIELEPAFPLTLGMKPVRIPAQAIGGCSRTCFGDGVWDADILVPATGTELSIPKSREVVDWCWNNRIPMVSGKDRRDWMYNRVPLPDRAEYVEQLSSREKYNQQGRQSCLGY